MVLVEINWRTRFLAFENQVSRETVQDWDAASYFLMSELVQFPISQQLWTGLSFGLKQLIINETINNEGIETER